MIHAFASSTSASVAYEPRHTDLVKMIAFNIHRRLPASVELDDLEIAGIGAGDAERALGLRLLTRRVLARCARVAVTRWRSSGCSGRRATAGRPGGTGAPSRAATRAR